MRKYRKLTEGQVVGIQYLLADGLRHVDIAFKYKVSVSCISAINNGMNWKHLTT